VEDLVTDCKQVRPDQRAAFILDWRQFRAMMTERQRDVADRLAVGYRATDIATQLRISDASVCLLRQRIQKRWIEFNRE
jgi:FixJ family two-component response regulator